MATYLAIFTECFRFDLLHLDLQLRLLLRAGYEVERDLAVGVNRHVDSRKFDVVAGRRERDRGFGAVGWYGDPGDLGRPIPEH